MTKSTTVYHEQDGSVNILDGEIIAVIGYGNQGRAQALNMRDSGLKVIIGNRDDEYKVRAQNDGFETYSISDAVKKARISFLLIPDEIMNNLFEKEIREHLSPDDALVFASGYNIAFNLLEPPHNVDVLMIAPRMIGVGVRETFLRGEGYFSFVHVHQDVSGKAREILLALAKGVGTLKKGAIDVTMKEEAVLDLFNEQGFGPAFGRVLLSSIYTLVNAGYPVEAVLVEMYMSGEMSYTYEKMANIGLVKQTNFHSHTSQYGAMSRGIKFMSLPLPKIMKGILENIENGGFAKEWENPLSKLKFKFIKYFAMKTRINKLEQKARKNLGIEEVNIYEKDALTEDEIKEHKELRKELQEFEKFYADF